MKSRIGGKVFTGFLIISLLIALAGCSNTSKAPTDSPKTPDQTSKPLNDYTKDKIQGILSEKQEIFQITWSPDDKMLVYIEQGKPEDKGLDKAYLWKVEEETSHFIRDVSPTTHGFSWSPDSHYFLISEKLGEGAINSILQAATITERSYKFKSISMPVWSPDSLSLAFGFEMHDYGESWGSLKIHKLGTDKTEYIWHAKNTLYKVEAWDKEGNISYIEMNDKGLETKKTTKNIRPSINGVHLGDTKEQVRAALGTDYEETPPGEETLNFPEHVYRWTYEKGFKVFIGRDSGEVLEIIATHPQAETNLGVKIRDTSTKVFEVYRPKYIEPESIHGGKLTGIFKVEGAAALYFRFDLKEGQRLEDVKPDNKVHSILLTTPQLMDDSF